MCANGEPEMRAKKQMNTVWCEPGLQVSTRTG